MMLLMSHEPISDIARELLYYGRATGGPDVDGVDFSYLTDKSVLHIYSHSVLTIAGGCYDVSLESLSGWT